MIMSFELYDHAAADAAAGAIVALAKHSSEAFMSSGQPPMKRFQGEGPPTTTGPADAPSRTAAPPPVSSNQANAPATRAPPPPPPPPAAAAAASLPAAAGLPEVRGRKSAPKARETRLLQNRKAARESRRRKRVMIEELQRSVIFFSRTNGALKLQNEELSRLLMQAQAQAQMSQNESAAAAVANVQPMFQSEPAGNVNMMQQAQAHAAAAQAMYESQGFSSGAAHSAAQTMNPSGQAGASSLKSPPNQTAAPSFAAPGTSAPLPAASTPQQGNNAQSLPQMQPGATMQAMANFQQAATMAMQQAMSAMQGVPGVGTSNVAAAPSGVNPQQVYADTMTALAMQQAAAAAAVSGQNFMMHPGMFPPQMMMPPFMWHPGMFPPQMMMPPPQMQQLAGFAQATNQVNNAFAANQVSQGQQQQQQQQQQYQHPHNMGPSGGSQEDNA
jgi:bZIP transcription factor